NMPRRAQAFSIWIRPVAPAHAHFAIRQAMRELRRLVEDGLTREAFEETRAFLLSYSRLWAQTPSRRLGYALDGAFYGRRSLIDELAERLPRLDVGQVNAAIRRHLRADSAFVAIVADPEGAVGFVERFVTDAPSPIVYDTETKPEVLAEDGEIAVFPLRTSGAKARIVPADAMFEGDGSGGGG
ncbi:MAG TPA: insulinase family protein, partial [Candidatus Bathyarchaeia archaeon]|nr:insulinase family protein [Candidatus Bathyarchaeia archaeon]